MDSVILFLNINTKSEDILKILTFLSAWMFHNTQCALSISCQDTTQMSVN